MAIFLSRILLILQRLSFCWNRLLSEFERPAVASIKTLLHNLTSYKKFLYLNLPKQKMHMLLYMINYLGQLFIGKLTYMRLNFAAMS